ncbi:hypothetical protein GCM10008014_39700 [Paenibacillus silvae]|uniref:Uncharacterized protein n=1 Tax=Paenibacillus silvae TaxID=1325358 RepID=A0ABQ1ZHZ1_9BACL|nr:hypothetical protein GCM10008014_39700 [Paenibacillus silvae]
MLNHCNNEGHLDFNNNTVGEHSGRLLTLEDKNAKSKAGSTEYWSALVICVGALKVQHVLENVL